MGQSVLQADFAIPIQTIVLKEYFELSVAMIMQKLNDKASRLWTM